MDRVSRQDKLETPRDKDEVNKWEIRECDGRTYDPDTMVAPLTPKLTRKAEALARAPPESTTCRVVRYKQPHILLRSVEKNCFHYSSIKRELKTRPIYECRCDERLKPKGEESTCLAYTELLGELEHLKIETRLIDEKFASVMGECVI